MFGSISMRMFVALVHIWAGFKKGTVRFYFFAGVCVFENVYTLWLF